MNNLKKNDIYIVAFLAVLIHSLVVGFTLAGIGGMAVVLTLVGFNEYLTFKSNKEEVEPLKKALAKLEAQMVSSQNDSNKTISSQLLALNQKIERLENTGTLKNAFNSKPRV